MANTCALRFPCRNSTRYLFSVSFFLAIFIILAFIDYESIYKGTNIKPVSRYKQSQLQRKVPERYDGGQGEQSWQEESGDSKGLRELMSQYAEAGVTLTEADKPNLPHTPAEQDGTLPLKKMFANAEEKDKKRRKSLKWNNMIVPLTDLKEEENKHQVLLLVIVSSAPRRYDRRNAIRQTWMSKCDTGKVVLMFEFLDMRYMRYKWISYTFMGAVK